MKKYQKADLVFAELDKIFNGYYQAVARETLKAIMQYSKRAARKKKPKKQKP